MPVIRASVRRDGQSRMQPHQTDDIEQTTSNRLTKSAVWHQPICMSSTRLDLPSEQSVGARYESLIRLADSIRAQHDTKTLFDLLVKELSAVIPFDAIAHCDESSNKVNWHFGESCQQVGPPPSDIQNEESLARWVAENQKAAVIADVRQET